MLSRKEVLEKQKGDRDVGAWTGPNLAMLGISSTFRVRNLGYRVPLSHIIRNEPFPK